MPIYLYIYVIIILIISWLESLVYMYINTYFLFNILAAFFYQFGGQF